MNSELLDRVPPYDMDAEKSVLGSMLLDSTCIDEVAQVVRSEDFYKSAHNALYDVMLSMSAAGSAIDPVLLSDRIQAEACGEYIDQAYIAEIACAVPYAKNAMHYAMIVAEHAERRRLIDASVQTIEKAYDTTVPVIDSIRSSSNALDAIQHDNEQSETGVLAGLNHLDNAAKGGRIMPIGFRSYDKNYGGFGCGELIVLAARPGIGKTALALAITENVSRHKSVLYISLEMLVAELQARRLSIAAGINGAVFRQGKATERDKEAIRTTAVGINDRQFHIWATPTCTTGDIARQCRIMQRKHGVSLLVVDYIQLLTPEDNKARRQEQVSAMSRALKNLALSAEIPVLALAQLNREAENEYPKLKHLRESGSIEQDADVVMLLSRNDREKNPSQAEYHVAKHRHGETRKHAITWNTHTSSFEDLRIEDHDNYTEFN